MIDIIRGATEAPVTTDTLIEFFENKEFEYGVLYSGYPIVGGLAGKTSIDGLFISRDYGVLIFDLVEGEEFEDRTEKRNDAFNLVLSKLISFPQLSSKRGQLDMSLSILTFAPAWHSSNNSDEIATNENQLENILNGQYIKRDDDTIYKRYLEVIQAVTKLKQKPLREAIKETSKGALLNKLEKSISNLDKKQNKAVIETTSGIQRIRGLAGSGKTIVLALKVAYLHSKYPYWNIGVTFYTRSLKDQFRELITKFTIEQKNEEPDWNKIKIMQAWGSSSERGIYYDFCIYNNIEYFDFRAAKNRFGSGDTDLLGLLCEKALKEAKETKEVFDIMLVDEAQDFSENFLKVCYSLLRSHDLDNPKNKRLIYAYDELQNLNRVTLRSPKEIFGEEIDFKNEPKKPQQDITLEKCYRNSGRVLVTAHALGFGIYREEGPVTMFKENQIWLDVGYKIESGELELGKEVVLKRDADTSPEYYKDIATTEELLVFRKFKTDDEQLKWVVDEIKKNIEQDELNHKDIIVIYPNALTAKKDSAVYREMLFKNGINSHLAGVNTSPDKFFLDDSIAFTSIYRAKGNEAPMIYLISAEHCHSGYGLITRRNILFTAITRSKCWVRVCGVGKNMQGLIDEYNSVKLNNFRLKFKYPDEEEMKNLNIIHRDLTVEEERNIAEGNKELKGLLQKLSTESIRKEDLTRDELEQLKKLLNDNE